MTDQALILLALVCSLLSLLLMLVIAMRQRAQLRRYRHLLGGPKGQELEDILLGHTTALRDKAAAVADIRANLGRLEQAMVNHVQRVGVVRFNAFPDTGSDLSFAIALLDGRNDGLVLTSLYGRNDSRIYAKPIRGGGSTYALSDEEKQALAAAMGEKAQ